MKALALLVFGAAPLVVALNIPRSTLTDCLNSASVPVLLTTSSGWAQEISPYNLAFAWKPAVVAQPTTLKHVQDAVRCASQSGIKVAARSGGHSYGAYGLGGQDGSLMVDLGSFQTISLDKSTNIATVGAGVRLGNMASKLFSLGGRAVPHGTCPAVGLGGHAILGGFGLDSRMWGLATDAITSMTTVLANGTAVNASATSYPDLYWALRGGGSSFAVVTEFRLKTWAAPADNTNWAYTYTINNAATAAAVYKAAQDWGQATAPKELSFAIQSFGAGNLIVTGVYYGTQAKFQSVIAPLLAKLKAAGAGKAQTSIKTEGWIASLTDLASPMTTLTTPTTGYSDHDTFYAKSIITSETAPLSIDAISSFFDYLWNTDAPGGANWMVINNLYGGPNSAINAVLPSTNPVSTSSYAHRSASYVWQLYAYTSNSQPPLSNNIRTFVQSMVDALGNEAADLPAYAPYLDPELERDDALQRYHGDSLPRLKRIKSQVDPGNIFWNPQSVM